MLRAVRSEIFVCVLLLAVLGTCVSVGHEAPVKLDTWWMVYVRDYANHRSTRKVGEAGDPCISSRMKRSINDSKVNFSESDRDGSRIGDSVESDFEWKVNRTICDQVVEGRVPPEKWTADSREAKGEGAVTEGRVGINVGEYCRHYSVC